MKGLSRMLIAVFGVCLAIHTVYSLSCYSCISTEAGCGKEMNIRLMRQVSCQDTGTGGGENFCVKVVRKQGSQETITRECLMTLRKDTFHRQRLPTVQRHGYCNLGRNDDPDMMYDENLQYCFCNDWNGCNSAGTLRGQWIVGFACSLVAIVIRSWS